ncbi:hypothetical protein A0H81_07858 [Grifola frondosa]|uniref:Uncharacterized protein n=1 Tax=Grifola frondosa TaxID=5627 RepID=A0A1C7M6M9_GRIFR|nr:hypothetical protein A0H81_07858 [Grifola frondosa]
MYSPRRSYGSPPPEISNNPFIDHPSNALTRFPDISGSSDLSSSSGYGGQQSLTPSTGYGAYQPQQTGWGSNTG